MAVTTTPKTLAFVQLANSKADITAAPGATKKHHVHNILLHNANSAAEIVELLHSDGTNEYHLFNRSMVVAETVFLEYPGEGLVIEAAGKLTGNAETASKVTCWVNGSERVDA